MIAFIKGRVVHSDGASLIVEAGGIGYRITVPPDLLRPTGQEVQLFVHTHMTQDSTGLFGFATPQALEMFETLLKVQGLGPAGAMKIMSGFSDQELRQVIQAGDSKALQRIKGVGPKLADKILFFLRGKLPEPETDPAKLSQVISALVSLGMKESEARKLASSALADLGPDATVEDAVKTALRGGL